MSDFWSRRKAAVEAETRAEEDAREAVVQAEADAKLAERSDADILADLGLPDPDEMVAPEQVRALLAAAVPQRLKTRALRKLWRMNPVLANLDGLVDYGFDVSNEGTVIPNMQTAYKVGKGMADRIQEMVDAAAKAAEEAAARKEAEGDEAPAPEPVLEPVPEPAAEIAQDADPITEEEPPMLAASSRRMRFRFESV